MDSDENKESEQIIPGEVKEYAWLYPNKEK